MQWSHSQVKGFGLTIEPAVMKNSQCHDRCYRRDGYVIRCLFFFFLNLCAVKLISLFKHQSGTKFRACSICLKLNSVRANLKSVCYTNVYSFQPWCYGTFLISVCHCCVGFVRRETRSTIVLLDCQLSSFNRYRC